MTVWKINSFFVQQFRLRKRPVYRGSHLPIPEGLFRTCGGPASPTGPRNKVRPPASTYRRTEMTRAAGPGATIHPSTRRRGSRRGRAGGRKNLSARDSITRVKCAVLCQNETSGSLTLFLAVLASLL
jgi:hypothetical protein